MHLPYRGWFVTNELKPLLTDDDVKSFFLPKGKSRGVAFAPVDTSRDPAGYGNHLRIQVDADDFPCLAQAFSGESCDDSGSTGDVENAGPVREANVVEKQGGPGLEQRADKRLLVHFGKAHLGEGKLRHDRR